MALCRLCCLALLLVLAACAGSRSMEPIQIHPVLENPGTPEASLAVLVEHLRPGMQVEDIRLAGPEGERVSAAPDTYHTVRGQRGVSQRPTVGIGASGGSSDGINPSLSLSWPLFGWSWAREEQSSVRSAGARIPLPEGYRDDPEGWRIEVDITDVAGATSTRSTPAPQ